MRKPPTGCWTALGVGLALLALSLHLLTRGTIWNLQLADQRYLVGGVSGAAALYFLYLALVNWRR